jgi:hypothetical protein
MISFLTNLPLWLSAFILIVPTTAIAMAGPFVTRRYVELSRLRTNNEVAGFKFATVGVLYAVLLAFAVVVVWERFNQADSEGAKEDHGAAIRAATTEYLDAAIAKDWPAMAQDTDSPDVTKALYDIYRAVLKFHAPSPNETIVIAEILRQVDGISDARRERLVSADGVTPSVIWVVLFVGAVVTIGFTFFFGTENIRAQALMTCALSVMIFAGLWTIVAIDHPFAGTVKVRPEALVAVLADFSAPPGQHHH